VAGRSSAGEEALDRVRRINRQRQQRAKALTKTLGYPLLLSREIVELTGVDACYLWGYPFKGVKKLQPVYALPKLHGNWL
jgi:hypothetical protein